MKINISARLALANPSWFRHLRGMELIPTLILLAASLATMVFCGWRGARAPDPLKGPRMIPWRFLMIGAAAVALLLLIHLTTLFGAQRAPWV